MGNLNMNLLTMTCVVFHLWKGSLGENIIGRFFFRKSVHAFLLQCYHFQNFQSLTSGCLKNLVRQLDPLPPNFWGDFFLKQTTEVLHAR